MLFIILSKIAMTFLTLIILNSNQAGEQDIQLTNDKIVVGQYSDPKKAQQGKPVNQGIIASYLLEDHKIYGSQDLHATQ